MGSQGLITAHISKGRAPIKTDWAQYGLLGCHSKEQHIEHENQSHLPHPLVRRNGLGSQWWETSLMNTQKWQEQRKKVMEKGLWVPSQYVWCMLGISLWSQLLKVGGGGLRLKTLTAAHIMSQNLINFQLKIFLNISISCVVQMKVFIQIKHILDFLFKSLCFSVSLCSSNQKVEPLWSICAHIAIWSIVSVSQEVSPCAEMHQIKKNKTKSEQ